MNRKSAVRNDYADARDSSLSCEGRYLLAVLRAFLNDREPPRPPEGFSEQGFWLLAQAQRVVAIVADELGKRPEFFSERLKSELARSRREEIVRDVVLQTTIAKVDALLEENGVRYLPLKGAITKGLYPQSYQRSTFDYDVLIDESKILRAKSLLENNLGYREHNASIKDYCFEPPLGFATVELHRDVFCRGEDSIFADLWSRAVPVDDERSGKGLEYRFSTEDFYLHMVAHLARHWLNGDVTIREFLDVWIFNEKFGADVDRASLDEPLREMGVLGFVQNAERAVRVWFGGCGDASENDETIDATIRRLFAPSRRREPFEAGGDPFAKRKTRLREFAELVFCSFYFKPRYLEIARRPFGTRFLWRLYQWSKITLRRVKKGGVLRKIFAFLSRRDDRDAIRDVERQFGFVEPNRDANAERADN